MVAGTNYRSRRLPRGLVAGLAGAAAATLVAGCGGQGGSGNTASGSSSATSSSASSSSATGPRESPLSKGLLPAGAFGPQATVVSLTLQQFQQATSSKLSQASNVTVDPPQCADALKSTQANPDQVKDLVAEAATTQGADQGMATVEAIMTGDTATGAVDKLNAAITNCPKITLTSPQIGQATVQFTKLDVPAIGDKSAAAQFTTTITPPGRPAVSVPALVGAVQDHDRLVLLFTAAAKNPDGGAAASSGAAPPSATPPDPKTFTALLQKAYTTEKKALD